MTLLRATRCWRSFDRRLPERKEPRGVPDSLRRSSVRLAAMRAFPAALTPRLVGVHVQTTSSALAAVDLDVVDRASWARGRGRRHRLLSFTRTRSGRLEATRCRRQPAERQA